MKTWFKTCKSTQWWKKRNKRRIVCSKVTMQEWGPGCNWDCNSGVGADLRKTGSPKIFSHLVLKSSLTFPLKALSNAPLNLSSRNQQLNNPLIHQVPLWWEHCNCSTHCVLILAEDLRDGTPWICVHGAQRITDSVTMRSS